MADLRTSVLATAINKALPAGIDSYTDIKRAAAYFLLLLPPHKHVLGTVAQALFNTGIDRKSLGVGLKFKTILRDPVFLFEDVTKENGMITVYVSLDMKRLQQLAGQNNSAANSTAGRNAGSHNGNRKRQLLELDDMFKKDKRQKISDAATAAVVAAGLTPSAAYLLPPPAAASSETSPPPPPAAAAAAAAAGTVAAASPRASGAVVNAAIPPKQSQPDNSRRSPEAAPVEPAAAAAAAASAVAADAPRTTPESTSTSTSRIAGID